MRAWVKGVEFRVQVLELGVHGLGFGVWGSGSRVSGKGFRVWGSEFGGWVSVGREVQGLGCWVWGWGFSSSGARQYSRCPVALDFLTCKKLRARLPGILAFWSTKGVPTLLLNLTGSSHRMYLSISSRKSTPPQNCQLIIYYY